MDDYIFLDGVKYRETETSAETDGGTFTISNLIPVFKNEEDHNAAKEKIGNELFGVFRKYIG